MGSFIFVIGGVRSGKSRFCAELAEKTGRKVTFIATCIPKDGEMKQRVSVHKKSRPPSWTVIEEDVKVRSVINRIKDKPGVIIIDCLGLFISNLIAKGMTEKKIQREIEAIARTLSASCAAAIVVSNEVGAGIVPKNALARRFRDITGVSNQIMSRYAGAVYVMYAGIPVKIK